jgi:hypothetical protein
LFADQSASHKATILLKKLHPVLHMKNGGTKAAFKDTITDVFPVCQGGVVRPARISVFYTSSFCLLCTTLHIAKCKIL